MLTVDIPATTAPPSRDDLMGRIEPLMPAIEQRRDEADRLRDIPRETIAGLLDAGVLRVFQPTRWGGLESDPRTFFALQNRIAEVCPSTAWVYGVLCVQSLVIGRCDEAVQADVWGGDDRALVCSSFAPVGQAVVVEGGFRLSGRWTFSSGSSFAQWALVGARVAGETPGAGPPMLTLFLIPRSDYEIVDVWNTFGLRGTGSNDLVAKDIFVPAHRRIVLGLEVQNQPGVDPLRAPLYRMPWFNLFGATISNLAIGSARGALRAFLEIAKARIAPHTGKGVAEDPGVAQAVARMAIEIDAAEAMFERHVARQLDCVMRDEAISLPEVMLFRTRLTGLVRQIVERLDELMVLQGSRAVSTSSRVTRTWLDLCAARAHAGNDPAMAGAAFGAMVLAGGGV